MFRRLVAIVLTLCMGWQSLAFAGAGVVLADADEQAHELLHFERAAHHHHDDHDDHDHGVHQDDSDASVTHVVSDAGLFSPALMSLPVLAFLQPRPERPEAAALPAHPLPFLDGLERPPRPAA